jgi:hypothetical protein
LLLRSAGTDTLAVFDLALQRLVRYSAAGAYAGSHQLDQRVSRPVGMVGGGVLAGQSVTTFPMRVGVEPRPAIVTYILLDPSTSFAQISPPAWRVTAPCTQPCRGATSIGSECPGWPQTPQSTH